MSPIAQSISVVALIALVGGALDAVSVRIGWTHRRNRAALVIVPLCIGVLRYISAAG